MYTGFPAHDKRLEMKIPSRLLEPENATCIGPWNIIF